MKIMAWNIQQGGQRRRAGIVQAVLAAAPDVFAVIEYRDPASEELAGMLREAGFGHFHSESQADNLYGSAIFSRLPFEKLKPPAGVSRGRITAVRLIDSALSVIAVYAPDSKQGSEGFWAATKPYLRSLAGGRTIVTGDLNTGQSLLDGPRKKFFCSQHFNEVLANGFMDCWRQAAGDAAREYSYQAPVNGYRIDHALVSHSLHPEVRHVEYLHEYRLAPMKCSDHSPIVATLG